MDSVQLKRFELVEKHAQAHQKLVELQQEVRNLAYQIAELDSIIIAGINKSTTTEIDTTNTSEPV